MADINNEEKIVAALEKQAELRQKISESSEEYLRFLKDIKKLNTSIVDTEKAIEELNNKIVTLSGEELEKAQLSKKILEDRVKLLKDEKDTWVNITKETSNYRKTLGSITQVKKDIGFITNSIQSGYNFLKGWAGLFEMDKSIRMSALSMGLLDKQTKDFRDNLFAASQDTIKFGVDIGQLAELQAGFSNELGRTVMLSQEGLKNLAAMSKATGLGAEGAEQLAAEFNKLGISVENTTSFVNDLMNDSSKMGLNAFKVVRNLQQNMKLLDRYNFKNGVDGLTKMVKTMTKLGLEVGAITPMAEKLYDIEGAVDMSAQLQVLGGEFSKLADPFDLMYKARNDMEGLTKEITDATAASAHFNSKNRQFEISALEMDRLRKVAAATNLNYEDLVKSAKEVAKFTTIKKQINYDFGNDDIKEFIENTAQLNKQGEAYITIEGSPKLVSQLSSMDKTTLQNMMAEEKSLQDRAKASQTFDETLGNLIKQVKTLLLPVLEGIDKVLRPVVEKFQQSISDPKFLETIKGLGEWIGKFIGNVGEFIYEHPKWSIALFGVFETAKWIANGVALGTGFNMATGKGGLLSGLSNMFKSIFGKGGAASTVAKEAEGDAIAVLQRAQAGGNTSTDAGTGTVSKLAKFGVGGSMKMIGGAAGGLLAGGLDSIDSFSQGKTGEGIGNIAGGVLGGALGTLLDPFLGPFGTMIGAWAGSKLGGLVGGLFDSNDSKTTMHNDAVMFNPKDKFLSLNDGTMIAGTNVNGNKDLAKALMSTNYAGGNNNSNGISKIEFGELSINGKLIVETPGNPNMGVDLLKNPEFIRELSKKIMVDLEVSKKQIQKA